MKKILFVFERMQVNGAAKSLVALLNAICNDYDVSLFLFSHDGGMMCEIPQNVRVLSEVEKYHAVAGQMKSIVAKSLKRGKFGLAWFRWLVFLQRALRRPFFQWRKLPEIKGDWDVVCSYADGFVAEVVINKVVGGKKVLWVHENYEENPKPKETLAALEKADAVVGVSQDAIRHLKNLLGDSIARKAFVVHNIVDPQEVRRFSLKRKAVLPEKANNIVSVGRISPEKGYDLIPSIIGRLKQKGVDAHWSIVGGGLKDFKESILADAKRRGVTGRIHFLGEMQNPHPWTAAADCFVQLSRHEGWCMTISEALALGKPVVATDLPVFREQIINGENGFLANEYNPDSFADAIRHALNGELRIHAIGSEFPCAPVNVKRDFCHLLDWI